jgi:pyruvate dehydrogenase E2 component (dihydrolipoamide acetyltransferase)
MYNFKFADIGEGIHEGQILKWLFKVGDKVKEGETLCIVETDKVNAEIPSPVDGVIVKLGTEVGNTIHVGDTLVLINDGSADEEQKDTAEENKSSGVVGEIEVSSEVIANSQEDQIYTPVNRVLATPVARHLANDLGINIKTIKGTGENGRVMKDDILSFSKKQDAPLQVNQMPVIGLEKTRIVPITKMRKTIAKNMVTSKSIIPHVTMMDEFNVTKLVVFRQEQKEFAFKQGVKLTYMAFIIKAITRTLKEFPLFNSSFDHEKETIIYKDYINIGIAVDTPEGLMVPNIKNADQKSILEIAQEIEILSKSANDRTIQLSALQNGTFTITNYGAVDALYGTPIIKHPEVAIIGIGKITKKPIVEDNEIIVADIMPISLAFDHRIIDGADAGRFSIRLKQYLSNPMMLLL